MPVAKFLCAQVADARSKFLASPAEFAIVEDHYLGAAEKLERRDVVPEISGEAVQLVAPDHAETVSLKSAVLEEAGPDSRHGPLIPGIVPVGTAFVIPGVLRIQNERAAYQAKPDCDTSKCLKRHSSIMSDSDFIPAKLPVHYRAMGYRLLRYGSTGVRADVQLQPAGNDLSWSLTQGPCLRASLRHPTHYSRNSAPLQVCHPSAK